MSNRVTKETKETDVKYIKKVTADKAKINRTKSKTSETESGIKFLGTPCLPANAD